jgi:hypothetical protein
MFRLIGLFALFPITMTLTISFFVLFTREKTTNIRLRSFALVVAVLLWLCAALALIGGIVVLSTGRTPCTMHGHGMGMAAPCPRWGAPPPSPAMPEAPAK